MSKTIELENGEWTYAHSEGFTKHGQHYKTHGVGNYVNFHLFDKWIVNRIREMEARGQPKNIELLNGVKDAT